MDCKKENNDFLKTKSKIVSVNLSKAVKSFGLPNRSSECIVDALLKNQKVKYNTKPVLKTSSAFYCNLADNLLANLPKAPNRYTISFVYGYYKKLG